MGSGASIPAKLTHDEFKQLSGIYYDEQYFNNMKDSEEHITKDQFANMMMNNLDKVVNDKFLMFCGGSTEMESKHFVKLCKDAELFDKLFTGEKIRLTNL